MGTSTFSPLNRPPSRTCRATMRFTFAMRGRTSSPKAMPVRKNSPSTAKAASYWVP